jgi:hypothetical protein
MAYAVLIVWRNADLGTDYKFKCRKKRNQFAWKLNEIAKFHEFYCLQVLCKYCMATSNAIGQPDPIQKVLPVLWVV